MIAGGNEAALSTRQDITRCVCGENDDNEGFMIQCEKCLVWQHGLCFGIACAADFPGNYFCEQCSPELHAELKHQMETGKRPPKADRKLKGTKRKRPKSQSRGTRETEEKDPKRVKLQPPTPAPPSPREPMIEEPDAASNGVQNAQNPAGSPKPRLSREERKLQKIMEIITKTEQKEKLKLQRGQSGQPHELPPPAPPPVIATPPPVPVDRRRPKKPNSKPKASTPTHESKMETESSSNMVVERPRQAAVKLLKPITPFYLGKKDWLLKSYRQELHRSFTQGYAAMDIQALPMNKRLAVAYHHLQTPSDFSGSCSLTSSLASSTVSTTAYSLSSSLPSSSSSSSVSSAFPSSSSSCLSSCSSSLSTSALPSSSSTSSYSQHTDSDHTMTDCLSSSASISSASIPTSLTSTVKLEQYAPDKSASRLSPIASESRTPDTAAISYPSLHSRTNGIGNHSSAIHSSINISSSFISSPSKSFVPNGNHSFLYPSNHVTTPLSKNHLFYPSPINSATNFDFDHSAVALSKRAK